MSELSDVYKKNIDELYYGLDVEKRLINEIKELNANKQEATGKVLLLEKNNKSLTDLVDIMYNFMQRDSNSLRTFQNNANKIFDTTGLYEPFPFVANNNSNKIISRANSVKPEPSDDILPLSQKSNANSNNDTLPRSQNGNDANNNTLSRSQNGNDANNNTLPRSQNGNDASNNTLSRSQNGNDNDPINDGFAGFASTLTSIGPIIDPINEGLAGFARINGSHSNGTELHIDPDNDFNSNGTVFRINLLNKKPPAELYNNADPNINIDEDDPEFNLMTTHAKSVANSENNFNKTFMSNVSENTIASLSGGANKSSDQKFYYISDMEGDDYSSEIYSSDNDSDS